MTIDDRPSTHRVGDNPARQLTAFRRAARPLGIRAQVDRLLGDVGLLRLLKHEGERTICVGAAITVAQAALELAVTVAATEEERTVKRDALRGAVLPALEAVGLEHVGALIEASLGCDIDASAMLRRSYARH